VARGKRNARTKCRTTNAPRTSAGSARLAAWEETVSEAAEICPEATIAPDRQGIGDRGGRQSVGSKSEACRPRLSLKPELEINPATTPSPFLISTFEGSQIPGLTSCKS